MQHRKWHGLENSDMWYGHIPGDVVENDEVVGAGISCTDVLSSKDKNCCRYVRRHVFIVIC